MSNTNRIPVYTCATMYCGYQEGLTSEEFYFNPELSCEAQIRTIKKIRSDDGPCFDLPHGEMLDFGGQLAYPGKITGLPLVVSYPINSEKDAELYELPRVEDRLFTATMIKFQDYLKSRGYNGVGLGMGSPFTMVAYMVNPELLLRWVVKRPDLVERLTDLAIQYLTEKMDILIDRYGIENCSASGNVPFETNELLSPRLFRKFALPPLIEMYERAKVRGVESYGLHICGNHNKTMEYFRELQLPAGSFISADEQNDLQKVAETLGTDYYYAGNVSSRLLVEGTPDEVLAESRRVIESMKSNPGGYALMTSCDLPINAKPENLKAMIAAAEQYGMI